MSRSLWKSNSWHRRGRAQDNIVVDDEIVDLTALAATWAMEGAHTAETRVLAIYEILEQILLSILATPDVCAMKTILLSQRVNRNFKFLIDRSEPIQQELFLKPTPHGLNEATREEKDLHWTEWDPLLSCRTFDAQHNRRLKMRGRRYKADPSTINDFVQLNSRYFYIPRGKSRSRCHGKPYSQGSWQRMLLCHGRGFGKPLKVVAATRGTLHINRQNRLVEGEGPRHIEILKSIEAEDTLGKIVDMVRLRARGQSLAAHGYSLSPDDVESVYSGEMSDDESDGGVPLEDYI